MEKNRFLKVFFPNGSFHAVRFQNTTEIDDLIRTILKGRISTNENFDKVFFALRISKIDSNSTEKWLHPSMKIEQFQQKYGQIKNFKFELRFRFFPSTFDALIENRPIFYFLYEQLRFDYEKSKFEKVPLNIAIELGSLEIRKIFRKSNFDFLEKQIGIGKFFPPNLFETQKTRTLRKAVKLSLKKSEALSEEECVKRFCFLLKDFWNWEQEIFSSNLGAEWSVPISLVIGPTDGISYHTQNSTKLTKLISFEEILSISTSQISSNDRFFLKLNVSRSSEVLTLTFPTFDESEDVAILIDCYTMIYRKTSKSFWISDEENRRNSTGNVFLEKNFFNKTRQKSISNDEDYAEIFSLPFEIDRSQIKIVETLGVGHFGEVYRAILKIDEQNPTKVAVKTCKIQDSSTTDAFLDEAYVMHKFDHEHIIKLIGIASDHPVLLIMELAPLGELRKYLTENRDEFDLLTLIVYCDQLCSALIYLESKKFVHRDIAVRNVLVSNHETVKLSDFGMSRKIALENDYYKASKGKLPIRWMAPESINFRRFTHSSDVWMFAVCMWEILSLGKKPFQGVVNSEVITQIERGIRLPSPGSYCPVGLLDLWNRCWAYEPSDRPSFSQIQNELKNISNKFHNEKNQSIRFSLIEPTTPTNFQLIEKIPVEIEERKATSLFSSTNRKRSNSRKTSKKRSNLEEKFSSNEQKEIVETTDNSTKVSPSVFLDAFEQEIKEIEKSVLKLTRRTKIDEDLIEPSIEPISLNEINDREQMQMVKIIAVAVRDLLETLNFAPKSIKNLSEQRYGNFSTLVVSLIEFVRQRNYQKMNEQAVLIGRTAISLSNDVKNSI